MCGEPYLNQTMDMLNTLPFLYSLENPRPNPASNALLNFYGLRVDKHKLMSLLFTLRQRSNLDHRITQVCAIVIFKMVDGGRSSKAKTIEFGV
jgi:hypothetical protein